MTVATNAITIAGAPSLFISKRDQYGRLSGFAGLSSSDTNTTSEMRRVRGIEQVPNPLPTPNRVRRTYDNAGGRIFTFPGTDIPQGDLLFGMSDIDLENAAKGSTSWTLGNWKKTLRGESAPVFQDMIVLAHANAASEDSGTAGTPGYYNTLYGSVQLLPLGQEQLQAQQTAGFRYSAALNLFSAWLTGADFDSTNFTADDGTSVSWWSLYPTLFGVKVGNGTWDTITTTYTPVDAASTKVYITTVSGGVVTVTAATISSVTPGTKTIQLSAAPTSGALVIYEYEAARLVV